MNVETLRKAGVGIKLASDACLLNDTDVQNAVQHDMSDGFIERQKVRDLTAKVNEVFRTTSRSELLRETIALAIKDLPPIEVHYAPRFYPAKKDNNGRSLVLSLGDFHYGADIEVEGLNGEIINRYNHEVFEQRMEKLLDETVEILCKENLNDVHVFLVGDLIDGILRQSQLMRQEYGIIESTMKLSEYMAQWLIELSRNATVHVHAATGNHSEIRPLKSKNREFEDENLEKIIMWYLHSRLSENPYIIIDPECKRMNLVDVQGFSFLLLHGDGDKSIEQISRDSINLYGKRIDYFVCGHKHKEEENFSGATPWGDSMVLRTPSICGIDKFAQSRGYGGKPGAMAYVIERNCGRRCIYPIKL